MNRAAAILILLAATAVTGAVRAQIPSPWDVTAGAPVRDNTGAPLAGDNPAATDFGETPIPGALVQVLSVGANGVADLPTAAGTPGGDDTALLSTVIGQGIAPEVAGSGRFSTSFYPPPTQGAKVYARAFNAPSIAAATHWGQSATFVVTGAAVFDVSARGLAATSQPKGSNPVTTDTDGDGQTDYQELLANTNPLDASDRLDVAGVAMALPGTPANVSVAGRAGRAYALQRSTDELTGPMTWTDVQSLNALETDSNLVLSDPSPPATTKAFYRVKVTMP